MHDDPVDDEFVVLADELCDRFEAELRAGSADIEPFLDGLPPRQRRYLLRELILVQVELASVSGKSVAIDELCRRFPDDAPLVHGLLGDSSVRLKATSGLVPTASPTDATIDLSLTDTVSDREPPASLGFPIDDYLLIDELGRGGMGVVYRALQRKVGRTVALKVLRNDLLGGLPPEQRETVVDRFRNEAFAAANLQHAHIVTVYDVGEANGQHYYSMQIVTGRTLADEIAKGPLECRRAARYLAPIARALDEAHRHGILHRDVKPANLLLESATDQVLIVDFGLAKLCEGRPDMTYSGAVFGSPPYMSPEQATNAATVTESADIYSLGATLYHLLAGRPPFQAAGPAETLRQVIADAPASPRTLNPDVDRDLETVCMKCLEKDPAKRYASASALADDLALYLAGKPILARPIGPWGRLCRWSDRNRLSAALIGLCAAALLAVVASTSIGLYRTSRALDREAEQRTLAEQRREDAMRYFALALNAVDSTVIRMSEDPVLQSLGLEHVRRDQLAIAREFYNELMQQQPADVELRKAQGSACHALARLSLSIGEVSESREAIQAALAIREPLSAEFPDRADLLDDLADSYLWQGIIRMEQGSLAQAITSCKQSQAIRSRLVAAHPESRDDRQRLAVSTTYLGRMLHANGAPTAAIVALRQAEELFSEIRRLAPDNYAAMDSYVGCLNHLGRVYLSTGELNEAEVLFHRAVALANEVSAADAEGLFYSDMLPLSLNNLAEVRQINGDYAEAERTYRAAQSSIKRLAEAHPAVTAYQQALSNNHNNLANLYEEQGRLQQAIVEQQESLAVGQTLVEHYPAIAGVANDHAQGLANLGFLLLRVDDVPAALDAASRAVEISDRIAAEHSSNAAHQAVRALAYSCQGAVLLQLQKWDQARAAHSQALAIRTSLVEQHPEVPDYRSRLAATHESLGLLQVQADDLDSAQHSFVAAADILRKILHDNPDAIENSERLARAAGRLSQIYRYRDDMPAARQAAQEAVEMLRRLVEQRAGEPYYLAELADAYADLAQLEPPAARRENLVAAIEGWERLYLEHQSATGLFALGRACELMAAEAEDLPDAIEWWRRAVVSREWLLAAKGDEVYPRHLLVHARYGLAETLDASGRHAEAVQVLRETLAIAGDESTPELRLRLAVSLALEGKPEDAVEQASQSAGGLPDADALLAALRLIVRLSTHGDEEPRGDHLEPVLIGCTQAALEANLVDRPTLRDLMSQDGTLQSVLSLPAFATLLEP